MKGVSLCESSHIASALSLVTMQQPWSRSMGIIGVLAKPAAINLCIALVKPCQSVWALTKKDNRADVFFNENRFSGAHYFLRLHDTHQLV